MNYLNIINSLNENDYKQMFYLSDYLKKCTKKHLSYWRIKFN